MTKELALRTIDSIAPEIRNGVLSPVELTQYMLSLHRKSMPASHTPVPTRSPERPRR